MRRLLIAALAVALASLPTACAPRTSSPEPAIEDAPQREAMRAHAQQVWPEVQKALVRQPRYPGALVLTSEAVAESTMGTPTVLWRYETAEGDDPWECLAAAGDRGRYIIPVLYEGVRIASLEASNYGGRWKVWPIFERASGTEMALSQIGDALGTGAFDWCYVDDEGLWVVGHSDAGTAGVYITPVMDHRKAPAPSGVLLDEQLKRWMDSPLGS